VRTKQAKADYLNGMQRQTKYISSPLPNDDCQRHTWQEEDSTENWGSVQRRSCLFIYGLSILMTLSVKPHSVV